MRLIFRLVRWTVRLSLLFWLGTAGYMISIQPIEAPASSEPANYDTCILLGNRPEISRDLEAACADYYAILGDRSSPLWSRLKQQVQGRLSEKAIDAYLAQIQLEPGQVVGGQEILHSLGANRLLQFGYETVAEAGQPASMRRQAQARCRLDLVRQASQPPSVEAVLQACAAREDMRAD